MVASGSGQPPAGAFETPSILPSRNTRNSPSTSLLVSALVPWVESPETVTALPFTDTAAR